MDKVKEKEIIKVEDIAKKVYEILTENDGYGETSLLDKLNWEYINISFDKLNWVVDEIYFTSDVIDWFWNGITLDSYDMLKDKLNITKEEYNLLNKALGLLIKNIDKIEHEEDIYWINFYLTN